jgi:DNA polymerase III subunit delta
MKLAWKDIEPFVKKPDPKARVVLIYGPDDGLMRERAGSIGKSVVPDLTDPFNVTVMTADQVVDDPARLNDEARSMSLMGGARLIRIEGGADKITPVLKDYLADPSAENLVVIEAGELGPKSTLRALCEKNASAAAVPCYVDDERGVANLIRQMAGEYGYNVQSDAVQFLTANISGDRARIRNELDKLFLYVGNASKNVTLDDARAACGEAGDQSIDDLIYAIGGGKTEAALTAYTKLLEEGVAVVTILRSMQNHFRRLHFVKSTMDEGSDVGTAMKALQPPIFFKQEDAFKSHLRKYSGGRLLAILQRLSQIEAQTKTTGAPVETLCSQAILSLAAS